MAQRKDTTEAASATKAAAEKPAVETAAVTSTPAEAPSEALKAEAVAEATKIEAPKMEAPKVELPALDLPKIEAVKAEPVQAQPIQAQPIQAQPIEVDLPKLEATISQKVKPAAPTIDSTIDPIIASAEMSEAPTRSHRFAIAASLAFATAVGGIIGAAATAAIWNDGSPTAAEKAAIAETRALKATVAKLGSEMSTLKSHIDTASRNSSVQLARLAERIDRTEKAQAEPAAKLARIAESLDRLERRPAAAPAPAVAAAPAPLPALNPSDITGSIDRPATKPVVVEGWKLHDFYGGRAVVENRMNGTLYEIAPGSNLPGVGRIETIKREDNRVIVVTPKGIITSSLEPRRPPPSPYMPYR
jgi:gas vesicle protein